MEFFVELPIYKLSYKSIEIRDMKNVGIGYLRREFKNPFEKIKNFISFLETRNLVCEVDGRYIEIREQSFKSNLFKMKWDVYLSDKNTDGNKMRFLLEDKTKISTNPRFLLNKNNESYIFKKDFLSRTCMIYCSDNDISCAEIRIEKLLPPSLKINVNNNDLTVVEILGVYYILNLVY